MRTATATPDSLVELPDLPVRIQGVVDRLTAGDWEVQAVDGRWYRMQIRPYHTADGRLDGAVLTFLDVNVLRQARQDAESARDFAQSIVETVTTAAAGAGTRRVRCWWSACRAAAACRRRSCACAPTTRWLLAIPHAVGQNYTIGDPSGARAFECSAGAKVRYQPTAGTDFTYHTNQPLVNTDWHADYLVRCEQRGEEPAAALPVCRRLASLERRVRTGQPITMQTIQAALASRDDAAGPICGDWTYGCTIFVLGDEPELHLAPGRPDRYAFQRFGF